MEEKRRLEKDFEEPTNNGLHPNNNGLHPKSDGFHPLNLLAPWRNAKNTPRIVHVRRRPLLSTKSYIHPWDRIDIVSPINSNQKRETAFSPFLIL